MTNDRDHLAARLVHWIMAAGFLFKHRRFDGHDVIRRMTFGGR